MCRQCFPSPFQNKLMLIINSYYKYFVVLCCIILSACTQSKTNGNAVVKSPADSLVNPEKNPYVSLDQSPMDMSYYPVDYPINKMNGSSKEPLVARLIYSRPHTKGREIFGSDDKALCQYGMEWRLGANEATEIEFYKPVNIGGNNVKPGSYILYCVPQKDSWTIVLNSNLNTWGLHMDASKDLFRVQIPVMEQKPAVEDFTMVFKKADDGTSLVMAWNNVKAVLPIVF